MPFFDTDDQNSSDHSMSLAERVRRRPVQPVVYRHGFRVPASLMETSGRLAGDQVVDDVYTSR
jgi:hypothetical protein